MKYFFIAGLFLSMTAVGLTIRCYVCYGCNTVTQSQLQDCYSIFDACSMIETSGYVVRSCSLSATGTGCIEVDNIFISGKTCTCQTDGCNGPTVPETTTLTSTESPTIRCYVCDGCDTVTQSQLQDCPSTSDACSMVETSGQVVGRSCGSSASVCTGVCISSIECAGAIFQGNYEAKCTCQTDGCNGPKATETTTLASTESPTIRCYVCDGCDTVTQYQLQDCSSTFDACLTVETSGQAVRRSCGVSASGCTGSGCSFLTHCKENSSNGMGEKKCTCQTNGCNRPTQPETTTLASSENGSNGGGSPKTTTLASTENGSNGGGAPKTNIFGSLIAVAVGKILM